MVLIMWVFCFLGEWAGYVVLLSFFLPFPLKDVLDHKPLHSMHAYGCLGQHWQYKLCTFDTGIEPAFSAIQSILADDELSGSLQLNPFPTSPCHILVIYSFSCSWWKMMNESCT